MFKFKIKSILIILIVFLILMPISIFGYAYYHMNSMYDRSSSNKNTHSNEKVNLYSSSNPKNKENKEDENVLNILLIGTDNRDSTEKGRSDAMMIVSINENKKTINLASLARDTYVNIPNRGEEKLNHAYSYGGQSLLIETIEKNLDINISNYVTIDFKSFIAVIEALGGLTLDVKVDEIDELNKYIPEGYYANNLTEQDIEYITKSGLQKLNGYQVLSYARIRKNDDAFARDQRQRNIIEALVKELSDISMSKVRGLINAVSSHVRTDIKPSNMIELGFKVLNLGGININQMEFPPDEYIELTLLDDKGWVVQFDKEKSIKVLHDFIYN